MSLLKTAAVSQHAVAAGLTELMREHMPHGACVNLLASKESLRISSDDRFNAFHSILESRETLIPRQPKFRKCQAAGVALATVNSEVVDTTEVAGPQRVRPSPAELARTLMEVCGEGTLATADAEGWPLATLVQFALDAEGKPVLRLDPGALHTVHLERDDRCSLHVQLELPGKQKPQCTIKGRICTPSDDLGKLKLETAWQRRYGKDMVIEEAQHPLCWIEVEKVLSSQDVGEEEFWVLDAEYTNAHADPLRDCAAKIVEDMNREHWEDIRRFCYSYAGVEEEIEEASMTWVDRLGFDLRVLTRSPQQLKEIRVPFIREVKDDRDARSSIIMMAQVAWEHERHYIPPDIPLLGARTVL